MQQLYEQTLKQLVLNTNGFAKLGSVAPNTAANVLQDAQPGGRHTMGGCAHKLDKCTQLKAPWELKGCPDTAGDGVLDKAPALR